MYKEQCIDLVLRKSAVNWYL